MRIVINYISGITFILLMTAGALLASCFLAPCVLLLPFKFEKLVRLRKLYSSGISTCFFTYATSLVVVFCKTRIRIHYNGSAEEWIAESQDVGKGVIVMANHRTRIDWMFVGWCYAYFINKVATMKIILATTLKYVPFFGWAMQVLAFIFLTRERVKDLPHIAESISFSLNVEPSSPCMLIFPEGTDLAPSNQEKCEAFRLAKQEQLRTQEGEGRTGALISNERRWFDSPRRFTLYPKAAGLTCIVKEYIKYYRRRRESAPGSVPQVVEDKGTNGEHSSTDPCIILHDLTIAYRDYKFGKRSSDLSLLQGEFPPEVHICVRKAHIPIKRPTEEACSAAASDAAALAKSAGVAVGGEGEHSYMFGKIEQYLQDSFLWKELLLSQYYSDVYTDQNSSCLPPTVATGTRTAADTSIADVFDSSALRKECENPSNVIEWPNVVYDSADHHRKLSVIFLLSIGVFVAVLIAFYHSSQLTTIFVKVCIMYALIGFMGKGIDMLELKYHWDYICNQTKKGGTVGAISAKKQK